MDSQCHALPRGDEFQIDKKIGKTQLNEQLGLTTASSGLIDLFSSFPPKNSLSISCIFGMRVDPPTSMI